MNPEEIQQLIESVLSTQLVRVSGDGRHFEATVVSGDFEGKSMIQQHRMVYGAIGERMGTDALHALSLKTFTPEQWSVLDG